LVAAGAAVSCSGGNTPVQYTGPCAANLSGAVTASVACSVFEVFRQIGLTELQLNAVQDAGTDLQAVLTPAAGTFAPGTFATRDLDSTSFVELDGPDLFIAFGGVPIFGTSIDLKLTSVDSPPNQSMNAGSPATNTHGTLNATLAERGDAAPPKTTSLIITF
jgi:hypothetical protein